MGWGQTNGTYVTNSLYLFWHEIKLFETHGSFSSLFSDLTLTPVCVYLCRWHGRQVQPAQAGSPL